jgi:heptosyltransferase-2
MTALIVKFGQIGDVVMALPAARALYDQGFEITWCCGRGVQPLLECYAWIRAVPVDDKAILTGAPLARARGIAGFWSKAVSRRYDLCATLYYDSRFRLLALPIRARRKLSLARQSRSREYLSGRNHADEAMRVVLGLEDGCREQSAAPVRPDRLPPSPLPPPRAPRRVAIVPGGAANMVRKQILRRWPVESYAELARRLAERGWEIVLLGGPDDLWVKPHFAAIPHIDCLGRLSLPEVVSACDACDAVVSHDTGPMHLAGLSEACLVGLFGPTDPAMFLPRRPYSVAIWGGDGFACRPCYDGTNFAPCQFNGCMRQIAPETVLRELDRLLAARSEGRPSRGRMPLPSDERTGDEGTGHGGLVRLG